jgi:hypothetical protein
MVKMAQCEFWISATRMDERKSGENGGKIE